MTTTTSSFEPPAKTKVSNLVGALALVEMLTWCRPHRSTTEERFLDCFIRPLGVDEDLAGNLFCRIGQSRVLWSCHTDTVHREPGFQKIAMRSGTTNFVVSKTQANRSCLGADDTAGVWLMREMVMAKVPGLYVFHRGEEVGMVGSSYIAANTPRFLDGIDHAIALDRMGTTDVITYQSGGRCCSDDFAAGLAAALGGEYAPCDGGVFTDTASYMGLIPECTNLSVGYGGQHTPSEYLDGQFLLELREKLLTLNVGMLPVKRDPAEDEDLYRAYGNYGYGGDARREMVQFIQDEPEFVADLLEQWGYDVQKLEDDLYFTNTSTRFTRR